MKGKLKQKSKKKKENVVLQKYMVAVDEFVKSKSGTEEAECDRGLRFVKKKSRKEIRKEKRKLKKAKMKSHYEGKKTVGLCQGGGENSEIPAEKQPKMQKKVEKGKKEVSKTQSNQTGRATTDKPGNSKMPSSSKKGTKLNKLQESRKMALMEANEQEDREIKKLERSLGLNKRKNKKSLPQSFVADGLDYILGMLDSGSSAAGMYDDDDDVDMAKQNFEKLEESDSQFSEDEEPGDKMANEGSDEDMASFDDENEDEDEDEMVDEEEAGEDVEEEEEMKDDQEEMDESDENEGETEEEADTPDAKTPESKSDTVSSQTGTMRFISFIALTSCVPYN